MSIGTPRRTTGGVLGLVAVLLIAITAASGPVAAHTGDDGGHHHDGWMGTHDGAGGWMGVGFGVVWLLLWTVVVIGLALALAVGYSLRSRRATGDGQTDDALAVLRRRYANGELDDEEFETRRSKLLPDQD